MRYGIVSDIHANLEALEVAIDWLREQQVDEIVCLGDVVGYGADPNECCRLVREAATVTLLGNHDAAVIGSMSTEYYYDAARDAIAWTRRQLDEDNLRWLYSLPYTSVRPAEGLGLFHSAPIVPSGYFYVVRKEDAITHTRIYDRLMRVTLIGHSHLTKAFRLTKEKAKDVTGKPLIADDDSKLIINVGSVGQPRDHNPLGCVGLFDTEAGEFSHHRFDYERERTVEKIQRAGLEPRFGERLFQGA